VEEDTPKIWDTKASVAEPPEIYPT